MNAVRSGRIVLGTLTLAGAFACGGEGARVSRAIGKIGVAIDTSSGVRNAFIVVTGLSTDELKTTRAFYKDADNARWNALVRVAVDGSNETPILGKYVANDSAVLFVPQYPFDAGRKYAVHVDVTAMAFTRPDTIADVIVELPAGNQQAKTAVLRMLPSGDVFPENLLRLYIEFSAPMQRTSGLEFIKLLDDNGREVKAAFLPLDADFWNQERTRYTAFLDPGRVKLGILPNEQMGRALIPGRKYSIVIDSTWRDENGVPLAHTFRREFRVSAAEVRRIDYKQWKLSAPKIGSRDTLVVTFERPLDNGLLKRALGVQLKSGTQVAGSTTIARDEAEWRFVPDQPWSAGDHNLVIFSILEDAAGNRIDGAFEVDMFNEIDKAGKQERYLLAFTIR
ncbi:MAG: hypothetical protein ABJB74_14440 [Gemmatimonas sp.]